jgi:hypothetical protein
VQIDVPTHQTMRRILRILLESHDWQAQPNIDVHSPKGMKLYTLTLETTLAKFFAAGHDFYNMHDHEVIEIDLPTTEGVKLKLRV